MSEELTENDTFVSLDIFAPTQSSVGAPEPEELDTDESDSESTSQYLDGERFLQSENQDHPTTSENSFQDSSTMKFNSNRQDSSFMWSLSKHSSPEALRQSEVEENVDAEDTLSIADAGDMCGSFDTATFNGNEDPSHTPLPTVSPQQFDQASPSSPSNFHSSDVQFAYCVSPENEIGFQQTPAAASSYSCDKPPLPPHNLTFVESRRIRSDASYGASMSDALDVDREPVSSQIAEVDCIAACSPEQQYFLDDQDAQLCESRMQKASRGYSTCTLMNPFTESEEVGESVRELVVISRMGDLGEDERVKLQSLALAKECPLVRLVKCFIDTISFQHQQLNSVKASEVNLAKSVLQDNLRRYSDVAQERSSAIDALVEEVDAQNERIDSLENENEKLKAMLEASEKKNKQVEEYYSRFDGKFRLTGDIVSDLEKVHESMERFRRESIESSELKDSRIEDFAKRLLQMEDIVSESRKRYQILEAENADLRSDAKLENGEGGDPESHPDTPEPNSRRHTTPSSCPMLEEHVRESLEKRIEEQDLEIENLRLLHEEAESRRQKLQEAFLSMNVNLEEAKSKAETLQKQRNTAESKCRELTVHASSEKKKFVALSNEMSKNLVQAVSELDQKESEIRLLRNDLEDRESAYRSLQCTNQDLEDQLQAFTEAALDRSRSRDAPDGSQSSPLVEAVIENFKSELEKAQTLLEERAMDLEKLKKALLDQDEANIALQKECSRLQAAVAVRRRSGSLGSPGPSGTGSMSDEDRFLRRLSVRLGCKSGNNRDLVEQLAKRVEVLMVERAELQKASEVMRSDLAERERALHKLRSEMQAEISALKCEVAHLENLKTRAQDELKSTESRLLQILQEGDLSRRESIGDWTMSSVGTRAWLMNDETEIPSRRGSMLSSTAGDDTIRWSDPIIDAAVQSVSALIGTKDTLAARNRELREKLQSLINSLPNTEDEGIVRAVMIQSKELQDELTGVVGMQQDIIGRLSQGHPSNTQFLQGPANDDTLPFIHAGVSHIDPEYSNAENTISHDVSRPPLGEATRFLNEQLSSTRALYSAKLRVNAELCGTIDELQEELHHFKSANINVESALLKLQETHDGFIQRLAEMAGVDKSIVSIEDFVRASLNDHIMMQGELERKEVEERSLTKRIFGLLAQKRCLVHMIGIYQQKYRLNILSQSLEEKQSLKRRLRVRLLVVVAAMKLRRISNVVDAGQSMHVSDDYDVPEEIDISQVDQSDVPLIDASFALAAVPRLEKAIDEKEGEISRLEASIDALNRSAAARVDGLPRAVGELPRSSYIYEDDVINRKNDMSRRLQKIIREKEELEERLSKERESRLSAEAKVVRYLEKISTYKKRMTKITSNAESKENSYKAAIRYLKNKADKAVSNDFNLDDENVAPVETAQGVEDDGEEKSVSEPNTTARGLLQATLIKAERELADLESGTLAYEERMKYVNGLRRTIQRLEKGSVLTKRHSMSSNRSAIVG